MTHKPITFASVKVYCLITLICPIILISHIAQLLLTVSFIVPVKVRIFPLNMHDIIIYVARWWEKYLSKRSPLKHPCSWRDKLIVVRILIKKRVGYIWYYFLIYFIGYIVSALSTWKASSWRDKLIVSWILNRQAKIFLRKIFLFQQKILKVQNIVILCLSHLTGKIGWKQLWKVENKCNIKKMWTMTGMRRKEKGKLNKIKTN